MTAKSQNLQILTPLCALRCIAFADAAGSIVSLRLDQTIGGSETEAATNSSADPAQNYCHHQSEKIPR